MSIHRTFVESLERRTLFTSSLSGVVYEDANHNDDYDFAPHDEGITGCIVSIKNNDTHASRAVYNAANGSFYFTGLVAGDYSITVTGPNLKKSYTRAHYQLADNDGAYVTLPVTTGSSPSATPPDLSVTVSTPPASLNSKSKPATVTIADKGGAYTGPLSVTAYFSADQIIDAGDTAILSVSAPVSIAAKKTRAFSVNLAPFASLLPGGNYFILVRLSGMTGDTNSANDTAVSKSTTNVPTPAINLVPTAKPGKLSKTNTIPYTLTIKNTGNVTATGPLTVALAARPSAGGADIPLTSPNPVTLTIQPNKSITFPRSATVLNLAPLPAGAYRIVLTISAITTPAESPTADNTILSAPFTLK